MINGTMNRFAIVPEPMAQNGSPFDTYVETQLAPTLGKGDVIIPDNLSGHKSQRAAEALRDIGAWFHCSGEMPHRGLSLPLQSAALLARSETGLRPFRAELIHRINSVTPFSPIGMAFSKLRALIRKAAARTYDELWTAVGHFCDLFSDEECFNFFKAAGYGTD